MALRSNSEGAGEIQESFSMEVTSENRNRVSKGIEAGSSSISHSNVHGQETQSQVVSLRKGMDFS